MKKLALFLSFLFVISCSKDPIIYTLTTSANPSDGGTVSPSTQQYDEGKTATINATPAAEYVFQSWSGATGNSSSTSLVMNSDKSVTANFVKKKYTLTTSQRFLILIKYHMCQIQIQHVILTILFLVM